ncbi:hypothetical protein D3C75_1006210 [compost metagenome]
MTATENWSPAPGVPATVNETPDAVAVVPAMVPVDTGVLSAVTGAAYSSKSVALVNLSTAPPPGKLAW